MVSEAEADLAAVVFLATILSCVLQRLQTKWKLPALALLLFAGFGFYVVTERVGSYHFQAAELRQLSGMWIMLVLIPACVFPYTFSLEWFTVRKQWMQLLLLSTIAPAASATAMVFAIAYILRYDETFSWSELVLLGIALSLIEHANVLYELKSVHASERLETLVQGEALTNSGTTVVAFTVALDHVVRGSSTSQLVEKCIRHSLGGVALGLCAAAAVIVWMKKAKEKQPHIILLLVFLTYYVAENTDVDVGGALATAAFSLYLCAYGKTAIDPSTEVALSTCWAVVKDNIEAVVLFLGGVFFASDMFALDDASSSDFYMIFPLFGLLHGIRLLVVVVLFPLLRCFGYGLNWREAAVLAVGTTKGSIVTCLGLVVHNTPELSPKLRSIALIWTVGASALSLLLDTLFTTFTLKKLGLENLSNAQEDMLVSVTTSVLGHVKEQVLGMKKDFAYKYVNWQQVQQATGTSALLMDVLRSTRNGRAVIKDFEGLSPEELFLKFTEQVAVSDSQIEVETRYRFFTTLKGLYWKRFYSGKLAGANIAILLNSANHGLDNAKEVMFDWYLCEKAVFSSQRISWFARLSRLPLLGRWFLSGLQSQVVNSYDVAWNFVHTHLEAERLLDKLEIDIDKSLFVRVMHESHAQIELCRRFVRTKIADIYPELNQYVQTKRACTSLLHTQKDLVEQAYQSGTLIQREHSQLFNLIDSQIESLKLSSISELSSPEDCIRKCEIFARMYEPDIRDVIAMAQRVTFKPKDFIYQVGESVPGIYLIQRGRVEEFDNDFYCNDSGVGFILGLHYIVKSAQSGITSARALTAVSAIALPLEVARVFERHGSYQAALWTAAAGQLLNLYIYDFGPLWELEADQQAVLLSETTLAFYEREEVVDVSTGGLLFRGGFNGVATGLAFIKPASESPLALANTVFFHLSQRMSDLIMANLNNLQYVLSTLTTKDASGLCKLYTEDQEEREGGNAPRIRVSLSSRFNSIGRNTGIFPNNGQRLSPRRELLRSAASSMALLSEPVSDTLGEEGQGFLQSPESRPSMEKNPQFSLSENLITVPSENVGISTDEESRPMRLSLKIPNFRK